MENIDPIEPYTNLFIGSWETLGSHPADVVVSFAAETWKLIPDYVVSYKIPWHDTSNVGLRPLINNFEEAVEVGKLIADNVKQGKRVLVTCYGGENRSGLAAAIAMCELGMSGREAVEKIILLRPRALNNSTYRNFIIAHYLL